MKQELLLEKAYLKSFFKKQIRVSIVRWILTLGLYIWLWEYLWMRLSLVIVLPLILFNMATMAYFAWKLKRIRKKLDDAI